VKKDLGFPVYQRAHKNEFVLARLAGLLDTTEQQVRITEFYASGGMQAWNRGLRKWRDEPCGKGLSWSCHECTMGHSPAAKEISCFRGTHTNTFKRGHCARCKQDDVWLDGVARVCVSCEVDANRKMVRLSSYGG